MSRQQSRHDQLTVANTKWLLATLLLLNIIMFEQLEDQVRNIVIDLCDVLVRHNIQQVHIGALMRLVGVDNEIATQYDEVYMPIDKGFIEFAREYYSTTNHHLVSSSIQ